jgi:hypothetical protein
MKGRQMDQLLRNFFYALGIATLLALHSMNPEVAQFKDVLLLLHTENFWYNVAALTGVLTVVSGGGMYALVSSSTAYRDGLGSGNAGARSKDLAKDVVKSK